jgi:flagellar assembly protein FliH
LVPAGKKLAEALPFPYSEVAVPISRRNFAQATAAAPGEDGSDGATRLRAKEAERQQGEREARAKFEEQLAQERSAMAKALADFAVERAAYYQKLEGEAVQLALSIARKVLHREAQVDPLLLMGIARVALGRIEGAAGVTLAVHPQRAADWRRYLSLRLGPAEMPEIIEDPALALEQCELRTSMGTAALGLEVQLKEIEHGLADLLAARPQARP